MINYWIHLRQSISDKKLTVGKSSLGDWFELLDDKELYRLADSVKDFPNDTTNIEEINLLVYNLCLLEGLYVLESEETLIHSVQRFLFILKLETLKRQHIFTLQNTFSFSVPIENLFPHFPSTVRSSASIAGFNSSFIN